MYALLFIRIYMKLKYIFVICLLLITHDEISVFQPAASAKCENLGFVVIMYPYMCMHQTGKVFGGQRH